MLEKLGKIENKEELEELTFEELLAEYIFEAIVNGEEFKEKFGEYNKQDLEE